MAWLDKPDLWDRLRAGRLSVTVGDTSGPSGGAAGLSTAHRVEGKRAADFPQPRPHPVVRESETASQAKRRLAPLAGAETPDSPRDIWKRGARAAEFAGLMWFKNENKLPQTRLAIASYVIVGMIALLLFGFWKLQVIESEKYTELAERNRVRSIPIIAPRGRMLDREGRVLVDNYPSFSLLLIRDDPQLAKTLPQIAEGLGIPLEDLQKQLDEAKNLPKFQPIVVKPEASQADIAFIESHRKDIPVLEMVMVHRRRYLPGGFMAHASGYVGEVSPEQLENSNGRLRPGDFEGKTGLEREYNDILTGTDGLRRLIVNSVGKEMGRLDQKEAIPETFQVNCSGVASFYGRPFKCWVYSAHRPPHGVVDLHKGVVHSCDVFFYNVGMRLGIDRIAYYGAKFGLGRKTGIDLPSEQAGLVPSEEWKQRVFHQKWYPGETISVAIGQGATMTTPLQIAHTVGGIALGGIFKQPHLLLHAKNVGEERFPLSEETTEKVTQAMWGVVNEGGTAAASRLEGIEFSGKTGSAQVISSEGLKRAGKQKKFKDNAWFVGYAPRRNPEIVVSVLVEEGEHGASVAAPIARDIIKAYYDKKARRSQQQYAVEYKGNEIPPSLAGLQAPLKPGPQPAEPNHPPTVPR